MNLSFFVVKKSRLIKITISQPVYELHKTESRLLISSALQFVNTGLFIDLSALFHSIQMALIAIL